MSSTFLQLLVASVVLSVVQALAALPWLLALQRTGLFRLALSRRLVWRLVLTIAVLGVPAAILLNMNSDPGVLAVAGRVYTSVLHLQLGFDFFVVAFVLLLTFWPKGGSIALASFQEGIYQPMFWLLTLLGIFLMDISVFIPYFTFGEDLKMVKELCYAFTMMAPMVFGVIAACTSVSEEIEGRTAVTLLSKPISRRQFLLGKFAGIALSALFMTLLLGWVLIWVVLHKAWFDSTMPGQNQNLADPAWVVRTANDLFPASATGDLTRGILLWVNDLSATLPGLVIGYCQVAVLIAVAIALATRVPMVVNLTACVLVYLLGHLTPVMTEVSRGRYALVHFAAQLFETLLPGLDLFDVGTAIVRDVPLDPVRYSIYTINVALYALTYLTIALLFGLILFEDRDVA